MDPSIYLTIGRGMLDGLVPYKNLLDIKGPIIFMLYSIFSTLKIKTSYIGIFILECLILMLSVTFVYKSLMLISNSKKWSFVLTLFYPFIFLNGDAFITGGESEEFILPLIIILVYFTLKLIKNNYQCSKYSFILQGCLFGIAFWIKYTTTGAWIAFYLVLFFIYINKKNWQMLKNLVIYSILGFLIPSFIIILFFTLNHAFPDLLWGYFGWNYLYGGSSHQGILQQIIFSIFHSFTIFLRRNPIIWILVIAGPYFAIFTNKIVKDKSAKILLVSMTLGSTAFVLIGGIMYSYYQLMAVPFVVITFGLIAQSIKGKLKIKSKVLTIVCTLIGLGSVFLVNQNVKKSSLFGYIPYQERFAHEIVDNSDYSKPSILDFNKLDHGWYNYLNVLPPTKYFSKMNFHYENGEYKPLTKAQLDIIKNKKVQFVIMPISKKANENKLNHYVMQNYKIIDRQKVNDVNTVQVILLERK